MDFFIFFFTVLAGPGLQEMGDERGGGGKEGSHNFVSLPD